MLIPEKTRKTLRLQEPYILHLDSLSWKWPDGDKLIRNYLEREWTLKIASRIDVNPDFMKRALQTIKTVRPVGLPQQSNSKDCGCFCTHFGEKFLHSLDKFKTVEDARKTTNNWFSQIEAENKRRDIANVIMSLTNMKGLISSLNL